MSVNPRDLYPILLCVTTAELAETVTWLQEHEGAGLPLPLARLLIAGEYKTAYDSREVRKWALESVKVTWEPKKKRWSWRSPL